MLKSLNFVRTFIIAALATLSWGLQAHNIDQSYLYLNMYESGVTGTVEMTYDDLNQALSLGLKEGMTLDDLKPYMYRILTYYRERIILQYKDAGLEMDFTENELLELKLGTFLRSHFDLDVPASAEKIDIGFDILFDKKPNHQNLVVIGHHWKSGIVNNEAVPALIMKKGDASQSLDLADASIWKGFSNMIRLGIHHIWIGLDHILFLVALALPSVMRRRREGEVSTDWEPVDKFKSAFWYILKIVTWFTIAHSITLSLAALGVINLPAYLVESLIALSIGLAAYHNIKPIFGQREWLVALGFGLFHGMGFASVLGEKGLNGEYMTMSLLGFNLGVEIGQVAIICMVFPILFLIRRQGWYKKVLLYGSILLILISLYWFTERMFGLDFLLDDYIGKAKNKALSVIGLR